MQDHVKEPLQIDVLSSLFTCLVTPCMRSSLGERERDFEFELSGESKNRCSFGRPRTFSMYCVWSEWDTVNCETVNIQEINYSKH